MKDNTKKIAFLSKKLEHIDNDLFKSIAVDLLSLVLDDNNIEFSDIVKREYISRLKESYEDKLKELRSQQKVFSRQKDLEEEIKEINDENQGSQEIA